MMTRYWLTLKVFWKISFKSIGNTFESVSLDRALQASIGGEGTKRKHWHLGIRDGGQ